MNVGILDKVIIRGRPTVFSVPAYVNGFEVTDPVDSRWESKRKAVLEGENLICTGMFSAIQNLMARDIDNWQAVSVAVGFGGDYTQPATRDASVSDTGQRVAAAFTDAYMRKPLYTAAIRLADVSAVLTEYRWIYTATLAPFGSDTDIGDPLKPYINEFGLLAANGTLLAHFIPPAADDGTTVRRAKTDLEWWVIQWVVEFLGTTTSE